MDKNSQMNYFKRVRNGRAGQCKKCSKTIQTSEWRQYDGMHAHRRTQHKINLLKRDKADEITSTTMNINTSLNNSLIISRYFIKSVDDSFGAQLTAKVGLPFVKFCTSNLFL